MTLKEFGAELRGLLGHPLEQGFERLLSLGVATAQGPEIPDDGAADVAFPAHRHVRSDPGRGDIADGDDDDSDRGPGDQRGNEADAVYPSSVALALPEQSC